MLSEHHHTLYWHPDAAHVTMEGLVFYSSGWLKTVCIVTAFFWLGYRAYQVLSKPVDELVGLLGLEVPVAPVVSLAGIKADGILLHWKPPDQRSSVVKYLVRVNGIDIGDVAPQETSVTITNLQPDYHYVVRIVTLNSANFQAPSPPLRLKTLPASSEQFYNTAIHKDDYDASEDNDSNPAPVVRPCKAFADATLPPPTPPPMTREHSNSQSRMKRVEPGRRNSPASQTADQTSIAQESAESEVSIQQLTERLETLRRDIEEVEKQIADEEEEFQNARTSLVRERDEKKQALKEREDASRELRKQVATLERANIAAQARKVSQEKLLHQKENERLKIKEDIAHWENEIRKMGVDVERIRKEKIDYEESSAKKLEELKSKHAEEMQTNKSLQEVVRQRAIEVQTLEEQKRRSENGEDDGDQQDRNAVAEAEEDRQWLQTLSALQQRYAAAWNIFQEAENANREARRQLAFLEQRRASQPHLFAPVPPQDVLPTRRGSQRRRTTSIRNEAVSSAAPGGFVMSTAPPFNTSISSISPTFANPNPYFNINNGMALPPPNNASSFSPAEVEAFTGGAPMSPTAGSLLPSGLFGDDADRIDLDGDDLSLGSGFEALGKLQSGPGPLPGLGAPQTLEHSMQSPSSPVSIQSRSPSVFASPRDSNSHLSFYPTTENIIDSDKRSIGSTSSSLATGGNAPTTRFGNLFGLNRQRGKTLSDQGPPLGSLKGSQSHSMPRQDHNELDPIGTQRRRGSHSGAWLEAFTRSSSSKTAAAESQSSPKHIATRRRAFNMFGSKGDPWLTTTLGLDRRPSSPRQGSTKSTETSLLPRPSTESQQRFGWPIDGFGQRSSPLGPDWGIVNNSSWSRHPSRRPSIQYGSSASLGHDAMFGDAADFPATTRSPTQAPIGTRPQSSASLIPPSVPMPPTPPKQLNPTAPNFKSIFVRDKKAEKAEKAAERAADKEAKKAEKSGEKKARSEKSDKSSRKEKDRGTASEIFTMDSAKDTSPLDPRRSRDNRSISTAAESTSSPRESLERFVSQTPSESQAPSSIGKESFMQKLSRKSSSGKFFPAFGKEKGSLFSKKTSEVGTPDETDEDGTGSGSMLGKSVDSISGSPLLGAGIIKDNRGSGLSWSSLKRMGKRGDKTPSLHESIASEATGDEEDGAVQPPLESVLGPV
ncbi:hypothetical protein AOQ84DRAFT_312544 [Glonium stellatum]|uniref:Fibronectin type-III domain-containing protein n=1 Tax=Glonium stellatum TaxID=574774 RepID=A0A8E2JWZ7_9PEZI|nr:hypothetical protein AOQ84DRAFT_312544 [Glonium stellatum]